MDLRRIATPKNRQVGETWRNLEKPGETSWKTHWIRGYLPENWMVALEGRPSH